MLIDIRSLTYDELLKEILALGFPKFRVNQIYSWIHEKCVLSFDEMTNISKDMREKLQQNFTFSNCEINTKLVRYEKIFKCIFNTCNFLLACISSECSKSRSKRFFK